MKRILLILILCLPLTYALDSWDYLAEEYVISSDVHTQLDIQEQNSKAFLESVDVNLSFFPREDYRQTIDSFKTNPLYTRKTDSSLFFFWDEPAETISLDVSSAVITSNAPAAIKKKVPFPITDLPEEVKSYTMPQETIDSDDLVVRQASLLASGEEDAYVVVFKLGKWVKTNINYSLNSLTEEASQPASWVMKNKYGVCDELTGLFISMVRSVGIPARYVSGVAYTNWNDLNDWGPHAWAEVYFPDYGWIPYDVTYGQFGYVDGSHIKLMESADSGTSSIVYKWRGRGVDVVSSPLEFSHELLDSSGQIPGFISINAKPVKDEVGFGSYNLIEADVTNLLPYYQAAEVRGSRVEGLELFHEHQQIVFFPNEEKKLFWLVKVPDTLEKGYVYTFPFIVYSERNESDETLFKANPTGPIFSKEYFESYIKDVIGDEKSGSFGKIQATCLADKDFYYAYETVEATCHLENTGNIFFEDISICHDECYKTDLGITQEKSFYFNFTPEAFTTESRVSISGEGIDGEVPITYVVYPDPDLLINDVLYPEILSFQEPYSIHIDVEHSSQLASGDVVLTIGEKSERWRLDTIEQNQRITLEMIASLSEGEHNATVVISYKDLNGRDYSVQKEFVLTMEKLRFWQKVQLFFIDLFG